MPGSRHALDAATPGATDPRSPGVLPLDALHVAALGTTGLVASQAARCVHGAAARAPASTRAARAGMKMWSSRRNLLDDTDVPATAAAQPTEAPGCLQDAHDGAVVGRRLISPDEALRMLDIMERSYYPQAQHRALQDAVCLRRRAPSRARQDKYTKFAEGHSCNDILLLEAKQRSRRPARNTRSAKMQSSW